MPAGILGTILDTTGQRVKERIDQAADMDKQMRDMQTKSLMDSIFAVDENGKPKLSPAEAEDAWDRVNKLHSHSKGIKEIVGKAKDLWGQVTAGHMGGPPAAREQAQQSAEQMMGLGESGVGPTVNPPQAAPGANTTPSPAVSPATAALPVSAQVVSAQTGPIPGMGPSATIPPPPKMGADAVSPDALPLAPPPALAQPTLTAPPVSVPAPTDAQRPSNTADIVSLMRAGNQTVSPLDKAHMEQASRERVAGIQAQARRDVAQTNAGGKPVVDTKRRLKPDEAKQLVANGEEFNDADGNPIDLDTVPKNMELGMYRKGSQTYFMPVQQQAKSIRPVAAGQLSLTAAKKLEDGGEKFSDINGNPIDLSKYPEGAGLKPFTDGTRMFYAPFSPNERTVTVGGQVYATSPMEISGLAKGGGTDLGASQVGTTATHEEMGVDPTTGAPVAVPLQTTRTPITPGITGRPGTPTAAPSTSKPTTPGASTAPATGAVTAPVRPLGAMSSGQYNANVSREIPLREAYTQIVGSPDHPDFTSLKSFASIADNPDKSKRLNQAVKATFDAIDVSEKAHGGITNLLTLYGGLPQAVVKAQADANADVINKSIGSDPELQRAYNAIMTSYANMVALRSFTKSSAAEFAVRKIEAELPIPGGNTFSSKDYYDKLSKVALNMENAAKKTPTMPAKERDYISQQVDELTRLSKGSAITPPPSSGNNAGAGASAGTSSSGGWKVVR